MSNHFILDTIRASKIKHWLNCPQKGIYESITPQTPHTEGMHVGAVVGELVHQRITGHEPTEPRSITFDEVTPNEKTMERQVSLIAGSIEEWLLSQRMYILDREISCEVGLTIKNMSVQLTGTIDAICITESDKKLNLIDFKTGKRCDESYIQLAIYAYLWSKADVLVKEHVPMGQVGYVYQQRSKMPKSSDNIKAEFWSYDKMVQHGRDYAQKAVRYATGVENAHYNPSVANCSLCRHGTCSVRWE